MRSMDDGYLQYPFYQATQGKDCTASPFPRLVVYFVIYIIYYTMIL